MNAMVYKTENEKFAKHLLEFWLSMSTIIERKEIIESLFGSTLSDFYNFQKSTWSGKWKNQITNWRFNCVLSKWSVKKYLENNLYERKSALPMIFPSHSHLFIQREIQHLVYRYSQIPNVNDFSLFFLFNFHKCAWKTMPK